MLAVSSLPNPRAPVALVLCCTGGGGRGCSKRGHGENDNEPAQSDLNLKLLQWWHQEHKVFPLQANHDAFWIGFGIPVDVTSANWMETKVRVGFANCAVRLLESWLGNLFNILITKKASKKASEPHKRSLIKYVSIKKYLHIYTHKYITYICMSITFPLHSKQMRVYWHLPCTLWGKTDI